MMVRANSLRLLCALAGALGCAGGADLDPGALGEVELGLSGPELRPKAIHWNREGCDADGMTC